MRNSGIAGHSTSRMHSAAAAYMVTINLLSPNKHADALDPTVTAIAAPTPRGARYITYLV